MKCETCEENVYELYFSIFLGKKVCWDCRKVFDDGFDTTIAQVEY